MRFGAVLLATFAAGCASTISWAPIVPKALPSADDHPDAPGLVLLDEIVVRFHEVDGVPVADKTTRRRVKILRDGGRNLGDQYTYYSKTFDEILDARARVTFPDGDTRDYFMDEMDDYLSLGGGTLYEDYRVLALTHTALPLGTVVEWESVRRRRQPELFQFKFYFGDSKAPTRVGRFEVIAPESWAAEHAATRFSEKIDFAPKKHTRDGWTRLVWEKKNLPGFEKEPYGPYAADAVPLVAARLVGWQIDGVRSEGPRSLDAFSKWLAELSAGTADPTPEIEAQVRAIIAGAPDDPKVKARRLYEWVRQKVRYVAIEVGLGGWRPYPAKRVFETKYGDCKDKATLLKSMLSVAGIDSHLASLYSHRGYPRRFVLPVLGNSNHAILVIHLPSGRVVADPTERNVPFGQLPLRDQEAELLMAREEGAEVLRTPGSTAGENTKIVELRLALGPGDEGRGRFEVTTTGAFASSLMDDLLAESKEKRQDAAKEWLSILRGTVSEMSHESPEGEPLSVRMRGDIAIPRLVGRSGPTLLFRLSDVVYSAGETLPNRKREHPVVFRKRERRVLRTRLEIPDGLTVARTPEPTEIDSEFGTYRLRWSIEGSELIAESTYELTQRIVPKESYRALKAFFDAIMLANQRGVLLRPPRMAVR